MGSEDIHSTISVHAMKSDQLSVEQSTLQETSDTSDTSILNRLLLEFGEDYQRRIIAGVRRRGHSLIRSAHCSVFASIGMGAVRVTELAERAHVTQQAMGKMLKELERIGYVVRDIDGSDRRAKKIRPTERGNVLMIDIKAVTREAWLYYVSRIDENTLIELEHQLADCVRKLNKAPRALNPMATSVTG
jgi:DNA-binding MarR family transcriptional regulator